MGEDGFDEQAEGMLAEIGGNVGDAKATVGGAFVVVDFNFGCERLGEASRPFFVFVVNVARGKVGVIEECVEQAVVGVAIVGLERDGFAKALDRVVEAGLVFERVSHRAEGGGVARRQTHRGSCMVDGFVETPQLLERDRQIGMRRRKIGIETQRFREAVDRALISAGRSQRDTEVGIRRRKVGIELDAGAEAVDRVIQAIELLIKQTQVVEKVRCRREVGGAAIRGGGLHADDSAIAGISPG